MDKSSSNPELDNEAPTNGGRPGLYGVLKTIKSLVMNGAFVFSVLYETFDAIIDAGFVAFGAKYVQQQFGLTASIAGIIFGQCLHSLAQ